MGAFGEMLIRNFGGDIDVYRGNKPMKKIEETMDKNLNRRALLVTTDGDWEGLWIDKKLHSQYHRIEEGEDRGLYFLNLAKEFDLDSDDFQQAHANEKADEYLNMGGLPEEYEKVITMVDFYEPTN